MAALRSEVAATHAELEVRQAAERRAKLELRARRESASRARAEAGQARSDLAGRAAELVAERAERARQFQQEVGRAACA